MRSIEPGQPVPPDGADVLVVEGLGVGLGGCDHPLNEIVYITLLAVNSGQRTVTEITPYSDCSPDVNVWKYVLTSLVNQVIAGAPMPTPLCSCEASVVAWRVAPGAEQELDV